jgi:hypothetical protein
MDLSDVHVGDKLIAVDGQILEGEDGVVSPKVAIGTKQMLLQASVIEELRCRGNSYCGVVRKAGSYAERLLHFRPSKLELRTRRDDGATLQLLEKTGRSWSVLLSVPIKHAQFGGHFDCEMHKVVLAVPTPSNGCAPLEPALLGAAMQRKKGGASPITGAVAVVADTGCPLVTKAEVSQHMGLEGTIVLNSQYSLWVSERTPAHLKHLERNVYTPIAAVSFAGGAKLTGAIEHSARVGRGDKALVEALLVPDELRVRVRSKRCKQRRSKSKARAPG